MAGKKNRKLRLFNRQRGHRLDVAKVGEWLERIERETALSRAATIVLVSDRRMAELNRRFRGCPGTTDVLAFPAARDPWEEDGGYLGDVVISVDQADRQRGASLEEEIGVLALHGVLHLLGYDHETDGGEMVRLERRLRRRVGLPVA
ncbi:MAG: rRNA maturation RNase YbeY [Acidobacteriota bacterium]